MTRYFTDFRINCAQNRKSPCVQAAGHFACVLVSLPDDGGLWSGNETLCAHAYKIRKWRPKQRTAASLGLAQARPTLASRTVQFSYIIGASAASPTLVD